MSGESGEKKKVFGLPYNVGVGLLCVLGVVCLYEFYSNVLAGPDVPTVQHSNSPTTTASAPTITMPSSDTVRKPPTAQRRSEEFNPAVHSKRPEDRIDPMKVDPTLRNDLLTKVQGVEMTGGVRNLFQMGQAPPPPKTAELAGVTPIVKPPIGPRRPPDPVQPPPPPGPVVTPLTIKFYGFSTIRNGKTTAYFMDGEDIILASEGEMLKKRYRVKSIQATSVLIEDTEQKRVESVPLTPPDSQS
jgi:hypothetical protein